MEGVADGVDGGEGSLGGQRESVLVLLQEIDIKSKESDTNSSRNKGKRLESMFIGDVFRLKEINLTAEEGNRVSLAFPVRYCIYLF